jgi:protein TonB
MFEGSLVESCGLVASKTQKWSALGSVALQCAVAALLIAIPMIRPQVLELKAPAPQITVPNLKPVQLVQQAASTAVSAAAAMALPARAPVVENTRLFVFPLAHPTGEATPAPVGVGTMPMGSGASSFASVMNIGNGSNAPAVAVRPRESKPVRVSTGVLNGMLLSPITPVYPAIARAAHVEGSVVVDAVISKAGRIEGLTVVSGPEMLRNAALDAIQRARYAPYRLNGEAVDVQTRITVVFRLGA